MQNNILDLIYDGSYFGFLSCVFYVYEHKEFNVNIQNSSNDQRGLFSSTIEVSTDYEKAKRVLATLKNKTSKNTPQLIYFAFLSEDKNVENLLFAYIKYIIHNTKRVDRDYSNSFALTVSQLAKKVGREKHRMEAFIRFKLTKDKIYFSTIEPDFNVIPILIKHFKSRYADQNWLIYDLKRKYGIYYNLDKVEFITLDFASGFDSVKTTLEHYDAIEIDFQRLWLDYFKSTNIESRKNLRLHIRHVPKRYWKYLSEKNPY